MPNLWFCPYRWYTAGKIVHASHPEDPNEPLCGQSAGDQGEWVKSDFEPALYFAKKLDIDLTVVTCKKCLKRMK